MTETVSLIKQAKNIIVPYKFKHRHLFIFPLLIVLLFLFFLNAGITFRFPYANIHIEWGKVDTIKYENLIDSQYFIKTKGCAIQAFSALNPIISPFHHSIDNIECHNNTNPPLIESDDEKLWVVEEYLPNYGVLDTTNFNCHYQGFYRPATDAGTSDDRFSFEEKKYYFRKFIHVDSEFVKVECMHNGLTIYTDYHSFVFPTNETNSLNNSYNVLIIGMDSISRLNFHRTMPKTHKFLRKINALEFNGYTKVGDNTYPNLVPILMGLSEEEVGTECLFFKNSTFDDCPLIWKIFKNKGYLTAFAEDSANIALFNYLKNGFAKQPTDYYWRPFNFVAENDIGHKHLLNSNLCVGPRLTLDTLLIYTRKFVNAVSKNIPFFGFFWETSLTHDDLNYPILADEKYLSLIKTLHSNGTLNNTVLIFLSDHGMRWGEIRKTHQGRIEERMPFLFIMLPPSFSDRYPLASENMKRNTKRLTTPFDIHETLVGLARLDDLKDNHIKKSKEFANSRGCSLFHLVNESRTCESAAIDDHWCTCNQFMRVPTNETSVLKIANFVVDHINNNLLSSYVQCAKLNISKIVDATVGSSINPLKAENVSFVTQDYTVVIETVPGNGLFEATVRKQYSGLNITGTISRINLYGTQSRCIDNYHLKLYCFCDTISKYPFFG